MPYPERKQELPRHLVLGIPVPRIRGSKCRNACTITIDYVELA